LTYAEFLAQWFNLPYLVAVVVGAILLFRPNRESRPGWFAGAALASGIIGLTLNGAIHDLSLGTPSDRFPFVFVIAVTFGIAIAFAVSRFLRRVFPPVTGVTWNEPGLEGSVAQIVTAIAGTESSSGRARVRDSDGVVHVIRVFSSGVSLRFGRRVRLGPFDDTRKGYPVEPV